MMQRMTTRRIIALVLAAAPLVACGGTKAETKDPEAAPVLIGPENLFVAETRQLQNGPQLSGSLVPERLATLRAELAGTVRKVLVEEGQRVTSGQLVGQISDEGVRDAVQSAQSGVRTATEAFQVAKRNADRSEKLARAGAVADRDLEQARWTVTNAEGALADAKTRLATAEKAWANTQLIAPFTGVVSERPVNPGDVVQLGNPILTIVDPSSLRLEAQVPVTALGSIQIGTPVPFTIDGFGTDQIEGKISRINPAVDPTTRQVRVTVVLPNRGGKLVAGLFAQGRAAVETKSAVVVPAAAIDRRGIRPVVTTIKNGTAQPVEVALGIEDPVLDRIEVIKGVAAGDTVITGSARGIQKGTKVRPAAAAERDAASR